MNTKTKPNPKVNLIERDPFFLIRIELPGIDLKTIKIHIKNKQIVLISGDIFQEEMYNNDKIIYKESNLKYFSRRIKLPSIIKYTKIDYDNLRYINGILYLEFEKASVEKESDEKASVATHNKKYDVVYEDFDVSDTYNGKNEGELYCPELDTYKDKYTWSDFY